MANDETAVVVVVNPKSSEKVPTTTNEQEENIEDNEEVDKMPRKINGQMVRSPSIHNSSSHEFTRKITMNTKIEDENDEMKTNHQKKRLHHRYKIERGKSGAILNSLMFVILI